MPATVAPILGFDGNPLSENCELDVASYGNMGGRPYMEDAWVVQVDFNQTIPEEKFAENGIDKSVRRAFFAVFDGHGGKRASMWLKANYHLILAAHPKLASDPKAALRESLIQADEQLLEHFQGIRSTRQKEAGNQEATLLPKDGSTAVVSLLVNNHLYVSNTGDSALAIISKKGRSRRVHQLTVDHGTENDSEMERMKAVGCTFVQHKGKRLAGFPFCCRLEEVDIGKPRAYPGGLLITRTVGDFHARLEELDGNPKGIVCEPSDCDIELDSSCVAIVLASDGVWDVVSNKELCGNIADTYSDTLEGGTTKAAAKELVEFATMHDKWTQMNASADNTCAILVKLAKKF